MQQPLKDFKGCLTAAGLSAFRAAAPGKAPADLAAHVTGCARCQERLLTSDAGTLGPGKRRTPPPLWRVLVIFFVGLIAAFLGFLALQRGVPNPNP